VRYDDNDFEKKRIGKYRTLIALERAIKRPSIGDPWPA